MISVGIGSAVGAVIRYLITTWWKRCRIDWPLATLFINVTGAILLALLIHHFGSTSSHYLFWGVGVMGGYTTFSTFNTELVAMFDEHTYGKLLCYLVLTYGVGLLAVWLIIR